MVHHHVTYIRAYYEVRNIESLPLQHMTKRNRMIRGLLLPMVIFLWVIGWSMVSLGFKKEIKRKTALAHSKGLHERDVTFLVPFTEENVTAHTKRR